MSWSKREGSFALRMDVGADVLGWHIQASCMPQEGMTQAAVSAGRGGPNLRANTTSNSGTSSNYVLVALLEQPGKVGL